MNENLWIGVGVMAVVGVAMFTTEPNNNGNDFASEMNAGVQQKIEGIRSQREASAAEENLRQSAYAAERLYKANNCLPVFLEGTSYHVYFTVGQTARDGISKEPLPEGTCIRSAKDGFIGIVGQDGRLKAVYQSPNIPDLKTGYKHSDGEVQ